MSLACLTFIGFPARVWEDDLICYIDNDVWLSGNADVMSIDDDDPRWVDDGAKRMGVV